MREIPCRSAGILVCYFFFATLKDDSIALLTQYLNLTKELHVEYWCSYRKYIKLILFGADVDVQLLIISSCFLSLPAPPAPIQIPAAVNIPNLEESVRLMAEMGIPDEGLSRQALIMTNGDVQSAVEIVFAQLNILEWTQATPT